MDIFKIAAILIGILGLVGAVVPVLPGIPLIFIAILGYGILTEFSLYSYNYILFMFLLTVFTLFIDYGASVLGAKKFGASRASMIGALAGGLIGIVILGPLGLIFGPFIGAVLGELYVSQDMQKSLRAGLGTVTGLLVGTVLKVSIGLVMLITFIQRIL